MIFIIKPKANPKIVIVKPKLYGIRIALNQMPRKTRFMRADRLDVDQVN